MIDVARHAQVSQTTVSLVLNNIPGVRIAEETRQRVIDTARAIGYSPGPAQIRHLEAGEAVLDVDSPGTLVDHRADRRTLRGQQVQNRLQGRAGSLVERLAGAGGHSVTSGATTTQRWGSSPSL